MIQCNHRQECDLMESALVPSPLNSKLCHPNSTPHKMSYLSNLTSNLTSLISTNTNTYANLSRSNDDTKSLTRYSDENALSDSDEEWKMNMLQEELNAEYMPRKKQQSSRISAPVLHDISSEEDEPAMEIHPVAPTENANASSSWINPRATSSWLPKWPSRNSTTVPDNDPLLHEEDLQQPASVTDRIKNLVSEASKKVGLTKEPPKPKKWHERWMETINEKITLSKRTRIYGFAITFIIGICCMGVSLFLLSYALVPLIARLFVILYTLGQIAFILSSFFLAGPITQIKQMLTPKRIIPSTIYIISLVLTILSAIRMQSIILCFILILIQVAALAFYIVTYIPYSGTFASMMIRGVWNSM